MSLCGFRAHLFLTPSNSASSGCASLLIASPAADHLGWFQVWAITNKTAGNTFIEVFRLGEWGTWDLKTEYLKYVFIRKIKNYNNNKKNNPEYLTLQPSFSTHYLGVLSKLWNFSSPQFLSLLNGDNNASLMGDEKNEWLGSRSVQYKLMFVLYFAFRLVTWSAGHGSVSPVCSGKKRVWKPLTASLSPLCASSRAPSDRPPSLLSISVRTLLLLREGWSDMGKWIATACHSWQEESSGCSLLHWWLIEFTLGTDKPMEQ